MFNFDIPLLIYGLLVSIAPLYAVAALVSPLSVALGATVKRGGRR
jgi:hypothetical protein